MKIKQICFVVLAIFFVLASVGVAGCIDSDVEKEDGNLTNKEAEDYFALHMHIFVDSETSVMYLYTQRGMTVLLNSDGTPKLYDPQTYTGEVYFF